MLPHLKKKKKKTLCKININVTMAHIDIVQKRSKKLQGNL